MPPKPQLTYAQLCYRAIKAMGGKATLQDICGWMIDNYDWYRYNEGAGWEVSDGQSCAAYSWYFFSDFSFALSGLLFYPLFKSN
jgi:hypothetical protein